MGFLISSTLYTTYTELPISVLQRIYSCKFVICPDKPDEDWY